MDITQTNYEDPTLVQNYGRRSGLHPAEIALFRIFKEELKDANFLDVGIGTGRTSSYLINAVKEYHGVDYSQKMIEYCKTAFPQNSKSFSCSDARNMPEFKDNQFDFVFFSFNGIDCVGIEDRSLVLAEIYRILKPGGRFLFSSHNTQCASQLKLWKIALNPLKTLASLKIFKYRKANNDFDSLRSTDDFFVFQDLDYSNPIELVYIKPTYQKNLLRKAGFTGISFYARRDGSVVSEKSLSAYDQSWLYYCGTKGNVN